MSKIKIALAQCECVDADVETNLKKLTNIVENIDSDTRIIIFPELFIHGFVTREESLKIAEPSDGESIKAIEKLAKEKEVTIVVGFAENDGKGIYNSVAWIGPEGLFNLYRKTHLWLSDKGVFDKGSDYKTLEVDGMSMGTLICFDVEFPEPSRALSLLGAEAIFLSNGNMDTYKLVHRISAQARAQENQVYIVICNRVGNGRNELFSGESMVVEPSGEIAIELGTSEEVSYFVLDREKVVNSKSKYNYLDERAIKIEKLIDLNTEKNTACIENNANFTI